MKYFPYYRHFSYKFIQANFVRIASTLRDLMSSKIYRAITLKVMSVSEQKVSDLHLFVVEISDIFHKKEWKSYVDVCT